jgi:hypothetical protein
MLLLLKNQKMGIEIGFKIQWFNVSLRGIFSCVYIIPVLKDSIIADVRSINLKRYS